LVGQYLVDISAELAPETVATYRGNFVKSFVPRFGREVELSEVTQALLTRHCNGAGLIWGVFDCRLRCGTRNAMFESQADALDLGCKTGTRAQHFL